MSVYDRLAYRGPVIDSGDGLVIEPFKVERCSWENVRLAMDGRGCIPGEYHRLVMDGTLWMSDTTAERSDHTAPVMQADRSAGGRGLVNGLGLGLVVVAMLDSLAHVDVVEADPRVVEHVGGWLRETYGDRVTIHHADAYRIKWPVGTTWDVAWHDIWPALDEDNLPLMAKLHRSYGRRVGWQGSWGKDLLEYRRARDRRSGWW